MQKVFYLTLCVTLSSLGWLGCASTDGFHERPLSEYQETEVLGTLSNADYYEVYDLAKSRLRDDGRVLRIDATLAQPGGSHDQERVVRVLTCTDCRLGLMSGEGEKITMRWQNGRWVIASTSHWIS